MKQVVVLPDFEAFGNVRRQVLRDQCDGIDPGLRWALQYPGATEIEFVVKREADQQSGAQHE